MGGQMRYVVKTLEQQDSKELASSENGRGTLSFF